MPDKKDFWFYKTQSGEEVGPFDADALRKLVIDGSILPDSEVADSTKQWRKAVSIPECGFDCLVLQVAPALDVLGPFAREYLDRADVTATLPQDGLLFVRSGTMADAASTVALPGSTTGAALVERIIAAENALRASEKRRREIDADMRAQALKFSAEIEGLKADAAAREQSERETLAVQARLVDTERKLASSESVISGLRTRVNDAEKNAAAVAKRASEAENRADEAEKRAVEAENHASEAEKRAVEAEKRASEAENRASEAEKRASEAAETIRRNAAEMAKSESVRSCALWLMDSIEATLSESRRRISSFDSDEPITPEVVSSSEPENSSSGSNDGNSGSPHFSMDSSRSSQMAALENQLRKELRMAGVAGGTAGSMANLFKKRR